MMTPTFDMRGRKLLVVDDEPSICILIEEALEGEGYDITTATSGEQALQAITATPFNLVITDKNMPGMSGIELIRAAQQIRPGMSYIIITAFSSLDSALDAVRLGVFDYIEKPIEQIELIKVKVREAIVKQLLLNDNMVLANHLRRVTDDLASLRSRLAASQHTGSHEVEIEVEVDLSGAAAPHDPPLPPGRLARVIELATQIRSSLHIVPPEYAELLRLLKELALAAGPPSRPGERATPSGPATPAFRD